VECVNDGGNDHGPNSEKRGSDEHCQFHVSIAIDGSRTIEKSGWPVERQVKRFLIKTLDGRELIVYGENSHTAALKLIGQKLYTLKGMVSPASIVSVAYVGNWIGCQIENDPLQVSCVDNQYEFAALKKSK
jgi:hypothetical protein